MSMFDFITRALRHPADYLGVLNWHKVTLVRTETCHENIHAFIFSKPPTLSWQAGQHGVWWFFDERLAGGQWRAFSIASSAHENELRIATILPETPSAFKQKLVNLKPGDTIWLQGPFGEFHAHNKTKLVGIAGGIGITPFRALAYEIAEGMLPGVSLVLIYASDKGYAFKTELDSWSAAAPALTIHYVTKPAEVNAMLTDCISRHGNDAHYLISGSPGMIAGLKKACLDQGVTRIVNDPFKGY